MNLEFQDDTFNKRYKKNPTPFLNATVQLRSRRQLFQDQPVEQEGVLLPILGVPFTANCFIYGSRDCLRPIGNLFLTQKIWIQANSMLCVTHLDEDESLMEEAKELVCLAAINNCRMQAEDLIYLLDELSSLRNQTLELMDFQPESRVSNENHEIMLGVSKDNFMELHSFVESKLYNSRRRCTYNALTIFLMKLRLNLSHRVLACLFGNGLTKQRVSYIFHAVKDVLLLGFLCQILCIINIEVTNILKMSKLCNITNRGTTIELLRLKLNYNLYK
jgi:hypothetical protein